MYFQFLEFPPSAESGTRRRPARTCCAFLRKRREGTFLTAKQLAFRKGSGMAPHGMEIMGRFCLGEAMWLVLAITSLPGPVSTSRTTGLFDGVKLGNPREIEDGCPQGLLKFVKKDGRLRRISPSRVPKCFPHVHDRPISSNKISFPNKIGNGILLFASKY